jgi:DNA-binding transcriptional LysR family regulator
MEIRDLHYFRAVIEAGGVTPAAVLLHMTPGALSKALRRFEDDVGHKLLKRVGRNLVPTATGTQLFNRSGRLLEDHDRLLAELDAGDSVAQAALKFGSFELFTGPFIAQLICDFLPDRSVHIFDLDVDEIGQAVLDRRIDYGLTYVPVPNRALNFRKLARIEFGLFGAPNAFKDVPIAEVPFVVPTTGVQLSSGERFHIDGWPSHMFERTVKYQVTGIQVALELVARGKCVICVPLLTPALHNATAKRSLQLVRRPLPAGMSRMFQTLYMVCRNEDRADALTREFATLVNRTLAGLL